MHGILFLGANPSDTARLALAKELREIAEHLRGTPREHAFELRQEWAVRVGDLQATLLRHEPHIVHFSGHGLHAGASRAPEGAASGRRDLASLEDGSTASGSNGGGLLVEDDAGRAVPLAADALGDLFRILRGRVRCVVLNACFSEPQAEAIARHVDYVVGMTRDIHDASAITFAWSFYRALGYGQSFEEAFELGRNQVALAGLGDADVPRLLQRSGPSRSPVPRYRDQATRDLSKLLEGARRRKRALEALGADTAPIDREIRELRRQIREGGELRAGDALGDGRYLLLDELGRGGFACVWHAHDRDRGERVAIKVLHGMHAHDTIRRERFFRGARTMAQLAHEAIVRVLEEHGEDGGYHYVVLELMAGGDLRRRVCKGLLPKEQVVPLILRVGDALAHAHACGKIHRDIKPANILLDGAGAPKLTDFDLVADDMTTGGTRTGAMGTFLYAAPELMDRPQDAAPAADVYGLGMTAVFCLFGADLPLVVMRDAPRIIGGLDCSPPVKKVLERAIEWKIEERYPDAAAFCKALGDASKAPPSERPPAPAPKRPDSVQPAPESARSFGPRSGVTPEGGPNLAGRDLRGWDLSERDLRFANLSAADLTNAKLHRAQLEGACLRGARLVRALVSRASLLSADLRDADLTCAQLLGADLRGAQLACARLRYARLLGARMAPGATTTCDVFGAALPGPVHPAVLPASSPCRAIAASPDGVLIASGHADGSVRIWDAIAGVLVRVFAGPSDVWSVAFTPDGTRLAIGAFDKNVRLLDLAQDGREARIFRGHRAAVLGVAFSPDGATLASGSADATIRLWDVASGAERRVLEEHAASVWSVAFSPDGATLASGSLDATVRLWDVRAGGEARTLVGHADSVGSVAFSPDGSRLASGSLDTTIRLWDVQSDVEPLVLAGHADAVSSVGFSPDGATLASRSWDGTVRLWDAQTGAHLRMLAGRDNLVWSVAFSPAAAAPSATSWDTTVRLWEVVAGTSQHVAGGNENAVTSVAFSPDGATLAVGCSSKSIRLWNVATAVERGVLRGPVTGVERVRFNAAGALACLSKDGTVFRWNALTQSPRLLPGEAVRCMTFVGEGDVIATAASDGSIARHPRRAGRIQQLNGAVVSLGAKKGWPGLVAGLTGGDVVVLGADGRHAEGHRGLMKGHESPIRDLAFSPDGSVLASASDDRTIRLWDATTWAERGVLAGHEGAVTGVAFSPDGARLASASDDRTVRIWIHRNKDDADPTDLSPALGRAPAASSEYRCQDVLTGHTAAVTSVAFHPGGFLLASASQDGTVRLWDAAQGACLAVLVPLREGWVSFTPSGRYKRGGETEGAFWHVVGLCRFDPGEIDRYVPTLLRVPEEEPLFDARE